jgi:hypothetical protein
MCSMLAVTAVRSRTLGSTCCRLNISSCRVRPAARSAAFADLPYVGPRRIQRLQVVEEELAAGEDHREEVVEVVGDASGQTADRFHLLRLAELRFESGGRSCPAAKCSSQIAGALAIARTEFALPAM